MGLMTASEQIAHYLAAHELGPTAAARAWGCTRGHVYHLLRGRHLPSRRLAARIEAVTRGDLRAAELLFGRSGADAHA